MAFSLDSDPTSPAFNCYVSVANATDYFAGRFGAEKWAEFTLEQQAALLATATREIDNLRFDGLKAVATQPLSWPRQLLEDHEGQVIPNNVIPKKLKDAVCELALWKWTEGDRWFSDTDLGQVKQYKVPGVEVVASTNPERFPRIVTELLDAIGPGIVSVPTGRAKSMRIGL